MGVSIATVREYADSRGFEALPTPSIEDGYEQVVYQRVAEHFGILAREVWTIVFRNGETDDFSFANFRRFVEDPNFTADTFFELGGTEPE